MAGLLGIIGSDGHLFLFKQDKSAFVETDKVSLGGPRGRDCVVFVPAVDVSVQKVSLPARNERDARRAAPYAIEDELAQPPEDVHVALSPLGADQMRTVCAVDVDLMRQWIETLDAAGLPEATLIAPQSLRMEETFLVRGGGEIFGRISGRYFALDEAAPNELLTGLTQNSADLVEYDFAGSLLLYIQTLNDWEAEGLGLNLRQGHFSVRRPLDVGRIKKWRLAGTLAAALAVFWVGAQVWSVQNTRALTATLETRSQDVVRAGWPALNGDVERALTEVRAQGTGGGAAFPSALTATAALYEAVAGVEGSELRSMRYDRSRGQVLAIVAYPDFGDGERLAAAFGESGLRARVGDARQSGRQVVAELVLEVGS